MNDKQLAKRFFSTAPAGMSAVMMNTIKRSLPNGKIVICASLSGKFTQQNKEKLSAYRVIAKDMNVTIVRWLLRSTTGTATARIS